MTETQLVNQILGYVRALGIFAWRQNTSGIWVHSTQSYRPSRVRGLPDILGVIPERCFILSARCHGKMLGLEVKRPGGKAEPHQQMMLDELRRHGAVVGVVHSWDETRMLLGESGILTRNA